MMGSTQGRSHGFSDGWGKGGEGSYCSTTSVDADRQRREKLNLNQTKNFPYLSSLP